MLGKDFAVLKHRFALIDAAFGEYGSSGRRGHQRLRSWHSMEGMLSAAWQTWGGFCRSVLLKSCQGTRTRGGADTVPLAEVTDASRLAYIARAVSKGEPVRPDRTLLPHQEPTWGDSALVAEAVSYLRPSNEEALRSGLLLETRAPVDMRTVRNATAHIHSESLLSVERIKIYYRGGTYTHPLDLLYWSTADTNEFVFPVWLSELTEMADVMTA